MDILLGIVKMNKVTDPQEIMTEDKKEEEIIKEIEDLMGLLVLIVAELDIWPETVRQVKCSQLRTKTNML